MLLYGGGLLYKTGEGCNLAPYYNARKCINPIVYCTRSSGLEEYINPTVHSLRVPVVRDIFTSYHAGCVLPISSTLNTS